MKLNLNFRDSTIRRISQHEFEFVFDLSNMNKPRLSQDARVYIEQFNVCEFLDEALGAVDGDLKGYFELRCNNIVNDGYDTEMGNTGGSIIFTSPLENYRSFVNNNPMFINNFKINQNFLDDRLVFNLKVYDRFGKPYDTSYQYASEIDTEHQTYKDYDAKLKQYNTVNDENEKVTKLLTALEQNIKTATYSADYVFKIFMATDTALFSALQAFSNDISKPLRGRIIAEWLQIFLTNKTLNSFKSFFEHQKINSGITPYKDRTIKPLMDVYYKQFLDYFEEDFQLNRYVQQTSELEKSGGEIITDYIPSFSTTENVKADSKNVTYQITDSSSILTHEGTLDVNYYNSALHSKKGVIISNLIQTTGTLANGDILNIAHTNFETSSPPKFTYYFAKDDDQPPSFITVNPYSSLNNGIMNAVDRQRFALEVERDGSAYNIKFLESQLQSVGFSEPSTDGGGTTLKDEIIIDGKYLGGSGGSDNLTILIETIDGIPGAEDIQFDKYVNPADTTGIKGTIDIVITKPNNDTTKADEPYVVKSQDYTLSKGYKTTETIIIPGSQLKGNDVQHDATLTVDEIYEDVLHSIDQNVAGAKHSIPTIKIDHNTPDVTILDNTGKILFSSTTPARPTAFGFIIESIDGQYSVVLDPDITSTGFAKDYQVIIKGSRLSGVDNTNDCILVIGSVNGSQIIESGITFHASSKSARQPEFSGSAGFNIDILQKLKSTDYEIPDAWKALNTNFAPGDKITILGSALGGTDNVNNVVITINKTVSDASGNGKVDTFVSLLQPAVLIDREQGEIKRATITGNGKFINRRGTIATASHTGTPVNTTTISMPNLSIEIKDDLNRSLNLITSNQLILQSEVEQLKSNLVSRSRKLLSQLGPEQQDKFRAMNMSMILYDEVPNYTQASKDALVGNTYSRFTDCSFKRI